MFKIDLCGLDIKVVVDKLYENSRSAGLSKNDIFKDMQIKGTIADYVRYDIANGIGEFKKVIDRIDLNSGDSN